MVRAVPGALTGLFALLRQVIALPAGGKGAASEPGNIEANPYKQQMRVDHRSTISALAWEEQECSQGDSHAIHSTRTSHGKRNG